METHQNINLKSSVSKLGKYVTQIYHGVNGRKLTFNGINTESIKQGQFTKMDLRDGRMLMINDKNVLAIEVFKEDNTEIKDWKKDMEADKKKFL